ncbi:MAG TPA: hypothetical protein PLP69_07045 [Bacteroidales bacterium]|nr:hypothetical protein [Bacteroidales bacterium]
MKNRIYYCLLVAGLLTLLLPTESRAQSGISCEGCFDGDGHPVGCGSTWTVVYNGTEYNCRCVCGVGGGPDCTPVSSSSSSSSSYSSGSSGDFRTDLATMVIGGLFNALNNWLNSPAPSQNKQASSSPAYHEMTAEEKAEIERKQAEYRQHIQEQVDKASEEYTKQINGSFTDKQTAMAVDFKTKLVKSESVKTIKQLNCAAYNSIQAAKLNCQTIDFNTLDGSMEQARSTADFANGLSSDCPEIKLQIPDVVPSHPVGFQQMFYQTVKFKADSINKHVLLLKESGKTIQKKIEEKKSVVEKLKSDKNAGQNNDQLMQEALKALKESEDQQDELTEEIKASEKNIELYDMIRSTYDTDKTNNSNPQK